MFHDGQLFDARGFPRRASHFCALIINAPMSRTAGAELATAVSKAGAFGMIGSGIDSDPSWIKEQIQAVREKTDRPFGVGFIS